MLVPNASNIEKDFNWITSRNRFDARLKNVSDQTTLLSIQGPRAQEILQSLTRTPLGPIQYYHFAQGQIAGADAILSRTGYTGEDGFEIYFAPEHSEAIWNAILKAGQPLGLLPVGLGARNTLRLEAKLLLYGNDMDETKTLLEAGLGWTVKLDKGDFVGRAALAKQKQEGVKRALVGFEMLGRGIARHGYPVMREPSAGSDGAVGVVTSGAPGLTVGKNIGLAYVPVALSGAGTPLYVSIRGQAVEAIVVPTPFYKRKP
jgi:aminomethyltransferase